MLKIKDNVDLKELERFGFVDYIELYGYYYKEIEGLNTYISSYMADFVGIDNRGYINIYKIDDDYVKYPYYSDETIKKYIQDLIQAGFVEEISEKAMAIREMFEELGFKYWMNDINQIYAFNEEEGTDLWFFTDKKVFEYNGQIDIDLLKAINKQIEELGWDNE